MGAPSADFWDVLPDVSAVNLAFYGRKYVRAKNLYLCSVVVFDRGNTTFLEIV